MREEFELFLFKVQALLLTKIEIDTIPTVLSQLKALLKQYCSNVDKQINPGEAIRCMTQVSYIMIFTTHSVISE